MPAFETSDGKCIFESNAISWAVANEQLRGKSAMDQALVVAWMNFAGKFNNVTCNKCLFCPHCTAEGTFMFFAISVPKCRPR